MFATKAEARAWLASNPLPVQHPGLSWRLGGHSGTIPREIVARMGDAPSDASVRYLKVPQPRDGEIAVANERRMSGDLSR